MTAERKQPEKPEGESHAWRDSWPVAGGKVIVLSAAWSFLFLLFFPIESGPSFPAYKVQRTMFGERFLELVLYSPDPYSVSDNVMSTLLLGFVSLPTTCLLVWLHQTWIRRRIFHVGLVTVVVWQFYVAALMATILGFANAVRHSVIHSDYENCLVYGPLAMACLISPLLGLSLQNWLMAQMPVNAFDVTEEQSRKSKPLVTSPQIAQRERLFVTALWTLCACVCTPWSAVTQGLGALLWPGDTSWLDGFASGLRIVFGPDELRSVFVMTAASACIPTVIAIPSLLIYRHRLGTQRSEAQSVWLIVFWITPLAVAWLLYWGLDFAVNNRTRAFPMGEPASLATQPIVLLLYPIMANWALARDWRAAVADAEPDEALLRAYEAYPSQT